MSHKRTVLAFEHFSTHDDPFKEMILKVEDIDYDDDLPAVKYPIFTNPFDIKYYCKNHPNVKSVSIVVKNYKEHFWVMENIVPYFKYPDYEHYISYYKSDCPDEDQNYYKKYVFTTLHNVFKLEDNIFKIENKSK